MASDGTIEAAAADAERETRLLLRLYRAAPDADRAAALRAHLAGGWRDGGDPNPWFSTRFYAAGLSGADMSPLLHYVRQGAAEGRRPHPWFDGEWYGRRYLGRDDAGAEALAHFLECGIAAGHVPHPALDRPPVLERLSAVAPEERGDALRAAIAGRRGATDRALALVDADWYRAAHRDVAAAGVDPAAHYLGTGWREGRDPNPWFSTRFYLDRNPDAAAEEICPLVHYVERGAAAGADPSRYFRTAWYARRYLRDGDPDGALGHFLASGLRAGLVPHPALDRPHVLARVKAIPASLRTAALKDMLETENTEEEDPIAALVDADWYRMRYPEIGAVDAVRHYLRTGWREGRDPNPWFSTQYYLERNRTATSAGGPLPHFVAQGGRLGRRPSAGFDLAWYARRHLAGAAPDAATLLHFLRVGLHSGLAPHPALDGPGLRDRVLAVRPADRSRFLLGLLQLASRLPDAEPMPAGVAGPAVVPWFLRPLPAGTTAVLLIAPPGPNALRLARLAGRALPDDERPIAAAPSAGGLVVSPSDGRGEIAFRLPADAALLWPLLSATRCARVALLGRWPGDAALARRLRAAGMTVSVPDATAEPR
ncbi:hypothetical protein [Stella sp.]|uniref:hypothetical protein n=1 Tax=Stella sp. TaxID=2912054 RepID=UPI0035B1BA05